MDDGRMDSRLINGGRLNGGVLFRISLPQQLDSINSSFAPSLNETKPCKQAVLDGEGLEKQTRSTRWCVQRSKGDRQ